MGYTVSNMVRTIKQLLDEGFVIRGIIKVEVSVISWVKGEADNTYRDLDKLIPHITKAEFNNCFIIHFTKTSVNIWQRKDSPGRFKKKS